MTVVYGQASDNQTTLPLKASAQVEGVAPKTLNVTGELVQDQTTIEITSGTLAPSYTKNERGKMDLSLRIKIILLHHQLSTPQATATGSPDSGGLQSISRRGSVRRRPFRRTAPALDRPVDGGHAVRRRRAGRSRRRPR